jgi:hypothetical protein
MQAVIEWVGGHVLDSNGVFKCANPISVPVGAQVQFVGVLDSVVGVTDPSVGFTQQTLTANSFTWNSPEGPNKGFRLETPQYTVDWKGDGTFPYTSAAADLRGVGWSHRVTWTSMPSALLSATPLRLSYFYRAAAATKTLTLELLVPDATTFYADELEMVVSYLDSSDVWRTEKFGGLRARQFSSTRTALSAGTAWTSGIAAHSAKQLSLTTAQPIKQDSEIVVRLSLCASRSPNVVFYVSPELVVS